MWTRTKPISMIPVTPITHFLPTDVWYRLKGKGRRRLGRRNTGWLADCRARAAVVVVT